MLIPRGYVPRRGASCVAPPVSTPTACPLAGSGRSDCLAPELRRCGGCGEPECAAESRFGLVADPGANRADGMVGGDQELGGRDHPDLGEEITDGHSCLASEVADECGTRHRGEFGELGYRPSVPGVAQHGV